MAGSISATEPVNPGGVSVAGAAGVVPAVGAGVGVAGVVAVALVVGVAGAGVAAAVGAVELVVDVDGAASADGDAWAPAVSSVTTRPDIRTRRSSPSSQAPWIKDVRTSSASSDFEAID